MRAVDWYCYFDVGAFLAILLRRIIPPKQDYSNE